MGVQSASTVVSELGARSAVGQRICEHGRRRSKCKECGGASICEHGRGAHECKECGGASICEHGRQRSQCKECGGSQYASTVVGALSARSAVGDQSASTVVSALHARSAVGHNLRARSSALSVQGVQEVANKNRQTYESKSFTVSLFHRRGELRSSLAKCNVKFVYAIDSPSRSSCACVLSARRGHLHDLHRAARVGGDQHPPHGRPRNRAHKETRLVALGGGDGWYRPGALVGERRRHRE